MLVAGWRLVAGWLLVAKFDALATAYQLSPTTYQLVAAVLPAMRYGAAVLVTLAISGAPSLPARRKSTSQASGCRSTTKTAPSGCRSLELGDYLGLPVNDAARLRADSYDADRISAVSEYQCRQHAPTTACAAWPTCGSPLKSIH